MTPFKIGLNLFLIDLTIKKIGFNLLLVTYLKSFEYRLFTYILSLEIIGFS